MSAGVCVSLSRTRLCALLPALLSLAPILCKDPHSGGVQSSFVQAELRCIEAVILAKIMETANADPDALLREIARLQKKPAGHYEGRCTENFVWWVHAIQYQIQSLELERRIRQALEESKELVGEIEKLLPSGAGVFHRGCVSKYEMPHRSYFNARTRDNRCLAVLRRACLAIIAETFHKRYEGRDLFSDDEFRECESSQSHLEEVVRRLCEHMSEFARSEDSTRLIRDLAQIELEYYRNCTTHE